MIGNYRTVFAIVILLVFFVPYLHAQELYPFLANSSEVNAWGYMDKEGNEVISPKYAQAEHFIDGYARVMVGKKNPRYGNWIVAWGLIDTLGNLVVPAVYERIGVLSDGLAKAMLPEDKKEDYWFGSSTKVSVNKKDDKEDDGGLVDGYINTKGEVVIPMRLDGYRYEKNGDFSEGLALHVGPSTFMAPVKNSVRKAIIDFSKLKGIPVDSSKFYSAVILYGFMDKTGDVVLPNIYSRATSFNDGIAFVTRYEDGKTGYIDHEGTFVLEVDSKQSNRSFSEGMSVVSQGFSDYGVVNKKNELVVPMAYDWIDDFSEGLAAVYKNEKYGFVNKEGQLVIDTVYSRVGSFSEGLASVAIPDDRGESLYGFINKEGTLVLPHKFYAVAFMPPFFKNGLSQLATFSEESSFNLSKAGYINKKGEWIYGPFSRNWAAF